MRPAGFATSDRSKRFFIIPKPPHFIPSALSIAQALLICDVRKSLHIDAHRDWIHNPRSAAIGPRCRASNVNRGDSVGRNFVNHSSFCAFDGVPGIAQYLDPQSAAAARTPRAASNSTHTAHFTIEDNMKDHSATTHALLSILTVLFVFLTTSMFASQFTVLHNFQKHPAAYPATGLIADPAGNLYGTTAIQNTACPPLCGSVFQLSKTSNGWQYHVIHNFRGPQGDGELPFGQLLLDGSGDLYGTTFSSGSSTCNVQHNCGTVFRLSPSPQGGWTETVLYRFKGKADGAFPVGNLLLDSAGNLYGVTLGGGSFKTSDCQLFGCGVVFELSPGTSGWTETALHTFSGSSDGWRPGWLTLNTDGSFLGITEFGGPANTGTVFKLTPMSGNWALSTLYNFTGGSDGAYPTSQLILDSHGNIYGSAAGGGLQQCDSGCGTIFELSPNGSGWTFSAIHSFSGTDGELPHGILFDSAGDILGVADGGKPGCPATGCGVLFKLVSASGNWTETVLYEFSGGADGGFPNPVVLDSSGNIFGTAGDGGKRNFGTLFEFTP
jgi:hypothetical protein